MQKGLKSFSHGVGQNAYHFVWKPKYGFQYFNEFRPRKVCEGVLRMIAMQHGMTVHDLKVMPDHVHIFVDVPPTMSVCKAMQLLKGVSSRVMRRNFPYLNKFDALWSPGKFFRSVGNVTAETIEHYITQSQGSWRY